MLPEVPRKILVFNLDAMDVQRLTRSGGAGPVNIGSDEMVSINRLVDIAGKSLTKRHVQGPLGVRGRTSNNNPIRA
ncbi:hypothetical protein [Nisaea sp.]|uniref:hypothetical protein n=1 Tax=Nisaea sp. TaxID=2024842 RepID=UPI003262D542